MAVESPGIGAKAQPFQGTWQAIVALCELMDCELSPSYGGRVTFSLFGQRESNPRERPPRLALAGLPARQVHEAWPGFSTGLLSWRKGVGFLPTPLWAFSSMPHRRTGAPSRAARSCAHSSASTGGRESPQHEGHTIKVALSLLPGSCFTLLRSASLLAPVRWRSGYFPSGKREKVSRASATARNPIIPLGLPLVGREQVRKTNFK